MIAFLGCCVIIASLPLWVIAGALAGISESLKSKAVPDYDN
jgi:hypothetical protein